MLSLPGHDPRSRPQPTSRARTSLRRVVELSELEILFEPDVNVVLLDRDLPATLDPDIRSACAALAGRPLLVAVEPNASGKAELAGQLPSTSMLAEDIHHWVEVFAALSDAELVGLRLVALTHAMCPRLHVDRMSLRAVVTYCGAGTEFVDGASFDRAWLQLREPPDAVVIDAAKVGDVVLLKGESWPDNADRGAIHRSPPASPASPRLVLTLDAL